MDQLELYAARMLQLTAEWWAVCDAACACLNEPKKFCCMPRVKKLMSKIDHNDDNRDKDYD